MSPTRRGSMAPWTEAQLLYSAARDTPSIGPRQLDETPQKLF